MQVVRQVPLRDRKGAIRAYASVDPQDYERVMQHRWCINGIGYVVTMQNRKPLYLHRFVMQPPPGMSIDHKDGNPLNNTRDNLVVCSHAQNHQNRKPLVGKTSPYRGVSWDKRSQKWHVSHTLNYKTIHSGYYTDELEAANVAAEWRAENMPHSFEGRQRRAAG